MTKPIPSPTCIECFAKIRKLTHYVYTDHILFVGHMIPHPLDKTKHARILQITRHAEHGLGSYYGKYRTGVWLGEWEHGGLFCSKKCGYEWALKNA